MSTPTGKRLRHAMSNLNGLISEQRLVENRKLAARENVLNGLLQNREILAEMAKAPEFQTSEGQELLHMAGFMRGKLES